MNDIIKRFNRIFSKVLFKLKEVYNWNKFVKFMLMAYNISQQNSTKMISYFLMYKRIARLPIEKKVFSKSILLNRVVTLIHKLLLFRESARISIKRV